VELLFESDRGGREKNEGGEGEMEKNNCCCPKHTHAYDTDDVILT